MTRARLLSLALLLLIGSPRLRAQIADPVPGTIQPSGITVDLVDVAQVYPSGEFPLAARLTMLKPVPGDDTRLLVGDLRGPLYLLRHDGTLAPYLDLRATHPHFVDQPSSATGFGSFALHPDFLQNGKLYTAHAETPNATADFAPPDPIDAIRLQWVLTEWTADDPTADSFSGARRELLRFDYHGTAHTMQEIAFNPAARPGDADYGLLYLTLGTGAPLARHQRPANVQTTHSWLGTIWRIDPLGTNSANGHYGIPADNPFARSDDPAVVAEIYSIGHRNPHRLSWDSGETGAMLIGEIGQSYIEEINLGQPGANYGWPAREGTFRLDAEADVLYALPEDDAGFTYPAAQYDHDEGTPEGRAAVVGGYVYRGTRAAELWGEYVFGDIVTGRIFVASVDALVAAAESGTQAEIRELGLRYGGEATTLLELVGHTRADLRFGYDNRGEVYVLSKVNGNIWRFSGTPLATDAEDDAPEIPFRPSLFPNPATDAVTLTFDRTPDARVTVYDLLGRTVLTARAAGPELRLHLGDRPSGVYFVRIEQADGVRTLRFVKR